MEQEAPRAVVRPGAASLKKGGFLVYETGDDEEIRARGMSAEAIADVIGIYARQLDWDLAPDDLRRTFAKLARGGQAPLE